jgi:hypothetical protein
MESSFGYVSCAISAMSTINQKAQTMLSESIIQVKREFRSEYGGETGSVEERYSTVQPRRSDEDVDSLRQAFLWGPNWSIS